MVSKIIQYPEHEKLAVVQKQSQVCGEFIEWLEHRGYYIAGRGGRRFFNLRKMLAEFFEIDENKLEDEKLAMLEDLRKTYEIASGKIPVRKKKSA